MEKFMRRNSGQGLGGRQRDCGRIGMFHSTAAGRSPNMVNEGIFVKWRATHQMHFIGADFLKRLDDLRRFPAIAMNHCDNTRFSLTYCDRLKMADFNWGVDQLVVTGGDIESLLLSQLLFQRCGDRPLLWYF